MKIIVTGALGHIGSALIRALGIRYPNAKIVMLDNMLTQRYASLFNLPQTTSYQFYQLDVSRDNLVNIFDEADIVIHLAAMTDAAGSFEKAEQVEVNNLNATIKVATLASEVGARLIALSSTSVYGSQAELVTEDCSGNDLRPQSPYAKTKLDEESFISSLIEHSSLKYMICRFGTIYGASRGMRFHTAVNKFCFQAAMSEPVSVWRTAYNQKRPYLDLQDAIRAIIFIIDNDIFDGSIYNILSENSTVKNIVDAIREFKPDLKINFVENEIMNQLSYEVSNKKFQETGFKFCGDIRRGVGETIALLSGINN